MRLAGQFRDLANGTSPRQEAQRNHPGSMLSFPRKAHRFRASPRCVRAARRDSDAGAGKTFTILPDWLAPSGHYSLHCRQQACERIAAGDSAEQAAPLCKDPTRLPDPSTVRRWAQRRLISVWCWIKIGVKDHLFLRAPTILAWDLGALCRILPIEARSP